MIRVWAILIRFADGSYRHCGWTLDRDGAQDALEEIWNNRRRSGYLDHGMTSDYSRIIQKITAGVVKIPFSQYYLMKGCYPLTNNPNSFTASGNGQGSK